METGILISRTDSIGDVTLTLPLAGYLKKVIPNCFIGFLCRNYTAPLVRKSGFVDEVIVWEERESFDLKAYETALMIFPEKQVMKYLKNQRINQIVSTSGRIHAYRYANKRVRFSRRKSDLHEAQLNFKLLEGIGIYHLPELHTLPTYYGLHAEPFDPEGLIDPSKFNLILHPHSKGSAREWPLTRYSELIDLLPKDSVKIFVSGTAGEGIRLKEFLLAHQNCITDVTGKYSLEEFIGFIAAADGLLAASTGPLHIAAALGKHALGIFPPIRPMHPGRWAPLGQHAKVFVKDAPCSACKKLESCQCVSSISSDEIGSYLQTLYL